MADQTQQQETVSETATARRPLKRVYEPGQDREPMTVRPYIGPGSIRETDRTPVGNVKSSTPNTFGVGGCRVNGGMGGRKRSKQTRCWKAR